MFDKLRRAKSFIQRTKHEEETHKQTELDFSETSHLRRNISIDADVLEKQKRLNKSREKINDPKSRKLQRELSRSHEHLYDQVLEQLRRINFGDSYSKKDAQKLSQAKEPSKDFLRRHPAYSSEKKFHRRSFGAEEGTQNRHAPHRTSRDIFNNFDRTNLAYCSERSIRPSSKKNPDTSVLIGSNDDFLLNRKSIDMSYNFNRRHPAYVSGKGVSRKKSDVLEKSGLRSLFQKITGSHKIGETNEFSDTSSFSGCSTGSSTSFTYEATHKKQSEELANSGSCSNTSTASSSTSVGFERNHRLDEKVHSVINNNASSFATNRSVYSSVRNFAQNKKTVEKAVNGNNLVTKSPADLTNIDRNHPAYSPERNLQKQNLVVPSEELSRKRLHHQTKSNFDRFKPAYSSERNFIGESRKKTFDRIRRDINNRQE